jgi:hypothetical protein
MKKDPIVYKLVGMLILVYIVMMLVIAFVG